MANLIPGSQVVVYAMREVTFGTGRKPSGVEGMLPLDVSFTPSEEREPRDDRSASSDYLETVQGRKSATWEVSRLLLPSGNVTVRPDDWRLLEAGFGHLSTSATAMEFYPATAHTTSLTIRRGVRANDASVADFQDHVVGAIVNRIEFAWGSQGRNNLAMVTYGGPAKEWGFTGNSTLNCGGVNMTLLTGDVTVTNSLHFTKWSVVEIARGVGGLTRDTGGNSGIMATQINGTTHRYYFGETLNGTHSAGQAIKPYNPTAVTCGSPIHAKLGFLSLDGSASQIRHLGGRITFEDNRDLLMDEVGVDSASEVLRKGKRNVSFTLDFYAKKTEVGTILGKAYRGDALNLQVNVGEGTGSTVRFVMRNCEANVVAPDIPDNDMARVTLTGRALGTNGNDSLRVKIV